MTFYLRVKADSDKMDGDTTRVLAAAKQASGGPSTINRQINDT
jgi:hypothetical protein